MAKQNMTSIAVDSDVHEFIRKRTEKGETFNNALRKILRIDK